MTYRPFWIVILCAWLVAGCDQQASETAQTTTPPVIAQDAIASAHPLATQAGMQILANGGNAFDAAIAVAAVLGVVEPYSAGIGGGGFWLIHRASDGKEVMIDAREKAPMAAHRDLYLNDANQVDRDKATNTPLAAGIPGQAAAFTHLAQHYGKLPLQASLAQAIEYAQHGFPADQLYVDRVQRKLAILQRYPESLKIFANGGQLEQGDIIRQTDLANTLTALAEQGFAGFYKGQVAQDLVAGVTANGGIWTLEDLAGYNIVERQPIRTRFTYNNQPVTLISAPPPSSGGIAIAQMFNMLSHLDLTPLNEVQQTHLIVEAMRRAYRDRAEHLGDPDFYPVPVEKLLNPTYIESLIDNLSHTHATASSDLAPAAPPPSGPNTTHLSVLDRYGNYVSATLSINLSFGSGFTVAKTGVLLNNEMDDFSAKPGSPNAYGLVGNAANAIEPGKRPLSSMTPSFMEFGEPGKQQIAILGTPGGSRIITMVFLGMLEALNGKPPEAWVARPRFHHQYLPDRLFFEEDAFSEQAQAGLTALGHQLHPIKRKYGNMQGILWDTANHHVSAASDPRNIGLAQVAGNGTKNE
ncbi:MAG: gamma-glutamyltransferase [Gammaproteobacteria bacterium]|nr:MAG: gamma-glutamyltransferase [Gammaproteobacteria bacterium]